MEKIKIISCEKGERLVKEVAKILKVVLVGEKKIVFSNNEIFARPLESVSDSEAVFVFQCFSQHVNDELMELFILLDALRRSHAQQIFVVLPYFPYARQDTVSEPRAPVTAAMIARILEMLGMYSLITICFHARQEQGFFWGPVDNLSLRTVFADVFKKEIGIKNPLVVAPDAGIGNEAKKFAHLIGGDVIVLSKERIAPNQVEALPMPLDIKGRECVIFEDMVDTGGTIEATVKVLRENEVSKEMYLIATHPILSGPAIEKLRWAGFKKIVFSDTIKIPNEKLLHLLSDIKIVSVAELLAQVIACRAQRKPLGDVYKYEER